MDPRAPFPVGVARHPVASPDAPAITVNGARLSARLCADRAAEALSGTHGVVAVAASLALGIAALVAWHHLATLDAALACSKAI